MARITFRPLWTIEVQHAFHGGTCNALGFTVPADTERSLAGAHALVRERDGQLHLLIEVDDTGEPLASLAGLRLRFGLKPRVANFDLITPPLGLPRGEVPVWSNAADANVLAGPQGVRISGEQPRIEPRSTERPLTLRLFDAANTLQASTQLNAGDDVWTLPNRYPHGPWRVEEQGAGPASSWALWIEPGLRGAWGVLDLTVAANHIVTPQRFTLAFAARSDTLRYYVVARRFGEAEFNQLSVQDSGFASDARPAIAFNRINTDNFNASHLSPALLDPSGLARIALFEAQANVPRRALGPTGLELHRNGDVLIGSLPQPGAERPDAQFVVHLSLT